MKSLTRTILAICFSLLLGGATAAQMGMRMGPPMPHGLFNPVVGSGALYQMVKADGTKTTMEIVVLGKESVGGKDGYWFEMTMYGTPRGDMIIKNLTVLDGANIQVARAVMQMPGRPPMEMSGPMLQMHSQPQPADIRAQAEDLGTESITTPAGTFSCHHYRTKDHPGEAWLSDKVTPYGLVKQQGNGSVLVLLKVISDAKDKITGTPVPFNPMGMGMGQPPESAEPQQ